MHSNYPLALISFLFLLAAAPVRGQGFIEKVTDLFEFNVGKPVEDTTRFQPKIVLAPIAYFEPNTSLGLGVGAKLLFKPKRAQELTRTSNLPVAVSYTLNNQFIFSSSYTVFFPEENWLLRGNLGYKNFPQKYYGIGNLSREEDRIDIAYQQFLFEPLVLHKTARNLFLGGGVRYNTFYNTELEEATDEFPEGFDLQDSLGSTSAGLELAGIYDSRDNVLNAQRGLLVELTQGFYGEQFGGTHTFQLTKLDVRRYKRLNAKSTLALNLFARHTWSDAPEQELSALGGESFLRGHITDRFRDRAALFYQMEYRYRGKGRIGFVTFAGAGKVAPSFGELDLRDLHYSIGAGLRLMIVPSERLNLRFDYALGLGPSSDRNFYLGIAEAF